jgi:NADPH2 dehydrogenase
MSSSTSTLFKPLQVGNTKLQHRIALAPLTRFRADDAHAPLPLVADYYSQRACVPGTLLVTEGTFISPRASGYPNAPGIWTADQIAAWRTVTDAVHKTHGSIWLQLWALGRVAPPPVLEAQGLKVSGASAIALEPFPAPTPLTEDEIRSYVDDYAQAARNAVEAGFDGVEIHGANGYLIDQFIQDMSNQRTDAWGGSVEKRARFALEVSKAVVAAVGAERTAIRLSPYSGFQGMKMADPKPQFSYLVGELKKLGLAYLHLTEPRIDGQNIVETTESIRFLVEIWGKTSPVLIAGGYTAESAREAVDKEYEGYEVVIVFGRLFISNPDLVYRIEKGIELQPYNRDTFYTAKKAEGYTDYPFSEQFLTTKGRI